MRLDRDPARFSGHRDRGALGTVLFQLVAQRSDRDAEDVGGMCAVAEAVFERLDDQLLFDIGDRPSHETELRIFAVFSRTDRLLAGW